jgi:hypothetical protein
MHTPLLRIKSDTAVYYSHFVIMTYIHIHHQVVYHAMDNSRVHHGSALRPLEFELDDAPAVEALLNAYPEAVAVKELPHPPADDLDDKLEIAKALFSEGFLVYEGEGSAEPETVTAETAATETADDAMIDDDAGVAAAADAADVDSEEGSSSD